MNIIGIFDVIDESLYSVKFDSNKKHEWAKSFDLWNNPQKLRQFFEKYKDLLARDYWDGITIEDAIIKTREEAQELEQIILELAETGKTNRYENLSDIFEPLSRGNIQPFERDKAKPPNLKSWIRIYAIRIDRNVFVVTGGAIKLTHRMEDAEYLCDELKKLEQTVKHLEKDSDNFLEAFEISI